MKLRNNGIAVSLASALALASGPTAGMTMSELQRAVDDASPGATVCVTGDIEYDAPLAVSKAIRLTSPQGRTNAIRRAATYANGTFLDLTSAAADLTLERLVVDGCKSSGSCTGRLVRVVAGRLSLGRGCVVRDFRTSMQGTMAVAGGELVLGDGASVVGLENTVYGVAVVVSGQGVFTMLGGSIEGCAGHWRGAAELSAGYDGAVYVYGGEFRAHGGRITGNTSAKSVGGVNVHSGRLELGGDFTCTGNSGGYANNIGCLRRGELVVLADFSGMATVRTAEDPSEGSLAKEIRTSERYGLCPGALGLTSESSPDLAADLASSVTQMWYATWRNREDARKRALHTLPHLLAEVRGSPVKPGAEPSTPPEKVLFDTDIGTDVDDAFALAYLLAEPRCQLLGVTTCFGAPELRAELASAICTAFGRGDVPIHPGRDRPLVHPREPTPPAQVKVLRDEPRRKFKADGSAARFLSQTIRANPGEVTLISVGPFMNIADLFLLDPDALGMLKRMVIMGGKFFSGVPSREWNCGCDPEATALVLGAAAYARIPATYIHGLDVTERTTRSPAELVTLCRQIKSLGCIEGVVTDFFRRHAYYAQCGKAMHDPLACVSVFHPEVCGYERGCAHVTTDARGVTTGFSKSDSGTHYVARTVDADAFYRILLATLDRPAGLEQGT